MQLRNEEVSHNKVARFLVDEYKIIFTAIILTSGVADSGYDASPQNWGE